MVPERRRNQRFRAYLPVRLHRPQAPFVIETLTKDISAEGFRCISSTLCPVSAEVGVELFLTEGDDELEVRGKAVWFRSIPESDQFDFGIIFTEVSPQNKRRLSAYIERLSSRSGLIFV